MSKFGKDLIKSMREACEHAQGKRDDLKVHNRVAMKTVDASYIENHFDECLDNAQRQPVAVRKGDRKVAVLVSWEEYVRLVTLAEAIGRDVRDAPVELFPDEAAWYQLTEALERDAKVIPELVDLFREKEPWE